MARNGQRGLSRLEQTNCVEATRHRQIVAGACRPVATATKQMSSGTQSRGSKGTHGKGHQAYIESFRSRTDFSASCPLTSQVRLWLIGRVVWILRRDGYLRSGRSDCRRLLSCRWRGGDDLLWRLLLRRWDLSDVLLRLLKLLLLLLLWRLRLLLLLWMRLGLDLLRLSSRWRNLLRALGGLRWLSRLLLRLLLLLLSHRGGVLVFRGCHGCQGISLLLSVPRGLASGLCTCEQL